jgi:D-alanyl-D-alanine carboxypeptidase/D-alanyl-D-alanine-endopeptidase (penicillin-binding protein 4)
MNRIHAHVLQPTPIRFFLGLTLKSPSRSMAPGRIPQISTLERKLKILRALRNLSMATLGFLLLGAVARAQSSPSLAERIQKVIDRPEFRHAFWGIEFYSLDSGAPVYSLNADKLFTPASTTKILTEGTALDILGADFRFHTRVYAAGKVSPDGTMHGDLVLVASGDPNLSGRIAPDGTLRFENEDHSYDGSPETRAVPGDPLAVIHELAAQVAAHGVKRIEGRVLVDASLYPEGTREAGTDVVISPAVVNDNIVDVIAEPGATEGAPVMLHVSPETAYVRFVNQMKTGSPKSKAEQDWGSDVTGPDGTHVVTITGNRPAGSPAVLFAWSVPQPSRFAEFTLAEALRKAGVQVESAPASAAPDFKSLAASYTTENLVAEHVSPPLAEEIKVTLKVSQNLHASMTPYLLGAMRGHERQKPLQAGFDLEHEQLQKIGLDLSSASQGDGAGGVAVHFTPDFMVHYLAYRSKQKDFPEFFKALPILGHDGTLWNIQTSSPAAGHVHAKTGTYTEYNALNKNIMVTAKGLAGYLTTVDGRHLAFAIYVNNVPVERDDPEAVSKIVGQAVGEVAAAAYDSPR